MPYYSKGKCVYKKKSNKKVGCTKGSVKKYLAALHANVNESIDRLVGYYFDYKSVSSTKIYDRMVSYNVTTDPDNDLIVGHKNGEASVIFLRRLGDVVHGKNLIKLCDVGSDSTSGTGPYSKATRSIINYNLPKLAKKLKTPEAIEEALDTIVQDSYDRSEPDNFSLEEGFQFEALYSKIFSE